MCSSVGHCGRISSSLSTCSWSSATRSAISAFWIDEGHLRGDRVLVERHGHAAEALRRASSPSRAAAGCRRPGRCASPRLRPSSAGRRRARAPRRALAPRSRSARCRVLLADRRPRAAHARVAQQQLRERVFGHGQRRRGRRGGAPARRRQGANPIAEVSRHAAGLPAFYPRYRAAAALSTRGRDAGIAGRASEAGRGDQSCGIRSQPAAS